MLLELMLMKNDILLKLEVDYYIGEKLYKTYSGSK